jgi:inosine/xanthosine triphosphatase
MKLYVGSHNPVKIRAAESTLRQLDGLHALTATGCPAPSGVPDQPMTEAETRLGAVNRVAFLREQSHIEPNDWCVAIEGGVDHFIDGPATFAYVVINQDGQQAVGRSANLPLPLRFYQELQQGHELGDVMDKAFGTSNVKQKGGAIGLLTNNLATRQSVYEVAMTLALASFRYPELYGSPQV